MPNNQTLKSGTGKTMAIDTLELYKNVINAIPEIELQGKSMLYTSANTHMFSIINKDGEIGFRYSDQRQKELFEELDTTYILSYNAKMRGYIKIPEHLYDNFDKLVELLKESHEYVLSLEPQKRKK